MTRLETGVILLAAGLGVVLLAPSFDAGRPPRANIEESLSQLFNNRQERRGDSARGLGSVS